MSGSMKEVEAAVKNNSSPEPQTQSNSLYIVGIGASAGGLDALKEFIHQLEFDDRVCYVILQHLSPNHESLLITLLEKECPLHIVELKHATVPSPGMIYVTPPSFHVEISHNVLKLISSAEQDRPKPSINRFFTSLAENSGDKAVGIILSGTGADGTVGLINIKSQGGIAIVQDPKTAKYDGMPTAAIRSNAADIVLPPMKMALSISGYINSGVLLQSNEDNPKATSGYSKIIELIRDFAGYDLTQYKKRTIERRIERRMALLQVQSLDDYVDRIKDDPEEINTLAMDIMICVTEFFRDPPAFEVLNKAILRWMNEQPDNSELRIWVPGCATGEEAYSIAILAEEARRQTQKNIRYQIFATDIDNRATSYGRQGRYPETALANMDKDLCERYFEKVGSEYVTAKLLRENIIFSVHNLIEDPPFSRVNIISCRNLLIYFTAPLQQRVMEIFYYALQRKGHLFLGKSEVVTQSTELFQIIDKQAKLYIKIGDHSIARPFLHKFHKTYRKKLSDSETLSDLTIDPIGTRLRRAIVSAYGPPAVVVSQNDDVLHVLGDVSPFLTIQSGPTVLKIYDLVIESFRAELRALVYKSRRENKPVYGSRQLLQVFGEDCVYRLCVRALDNEPDKLALVLFEKIDDTKDRNASAPSTDENEAENPLFLELEHELVTTREHLQTVVEELETSNEELQSVNEELQSSNEELQSTNEELQTSNEELQSTNEELLTVNDELQSKTVELSELAVDLENIQESINFPLIVVDEKLKIKRFGGAAGQIVDIHEISIGDTITSLPWKSDINGLRNVIRDVMQIGKTLTQTVTISEKHYHMIIAPYRMKDKSIGGAILMFPDISELISAKLQVENQQLLLTQLLDNMADGTITYSHEGKILTFSKVAEQLFGYYSEQIIGRKISILRAGNGGERANASAWFPIVSVNELAQESKPVFKGLRKDKTQFDMEISVNSIEYNNDPVYIALVRDVTERKKAEEALFHEKEKAQVTLYSIADAVITTNTNGIIEYMNAVAESLSGWSLNNARGQPVTRIFKLIDETTRELISNPILAALEKGKRVQSKNEVVLHNHENVEYAIEYSAAPIRNKQNEMIGGVLVFHDVTDKRELMRNMAWQARHDPLTGLVNRQEMERRIERAITSATSFQRSHALLYIDLDQFKVVNDTSGHQAGDELLRQISGIIGANLRNRDAFARLGGDEFGVLLENCSVNQAQLIAENIKEVVEEFRFKWDDKIFRIGASIGVVAIDSNSLSLAEVLQNADTACYAAKEQGRNRVQLHSAEDHELVRRRHEMQWVGNINQSLDEGRFELMFQPIASLNDKSESYWEVLLRMYDQNHNMVLPGVFLPAAERYGLINNIDRWVLRSSFTALEEHFKVNETNKHTKIGINISGTSICDQSFQKYVSDQFNLFSINPELVCFEITETAAIANFTKAREFIANMKKIGCRFALDDFGSGMSSFGYLRSLPVDFIKIDGAFVRNIGHDSIDFAMVESINRVGHIMDIQTIAEFAENDSIIDKLNTIGVDYIQGFGVKKPVSSQEFVHGPVTV